MHPFVTVIIPTYNRIALIQEAIASVVAQTYSHWELVVVDDGSQDGTAEAILSMNDSRIKLLEISHHGNIAHLRNLGVQQGSGEWLAFLDSDDIWIPRKLEIQLGVLLQEKKRWSYGGYELMNQDMLTIPNKAGNYRPLSGWIVKELLSTEISANIGSLILERTLFDEAGGFNEEANILFREDYELVIRLALRSEASAIPDILVRVREHNGRATNAFEYGHDRMAAVYEHLLLSLPGEDLKKITRRRMAIELAESAGKSIGKKNYFRAIPKLWKAFMNGDSVRHLLSVTYHGLFGFS